MTRARAMMAPALGCALVVLALGMASLQAQGQAVSNAPVIDGDPANPPMKLGREEVVAIISSEVQLAPGIGLRNLRLGEPLQQVLDRLGPPSRIEKTGLFKHWSTLHYTLDSGAELAVIGRKSVERIQVRGNSSQLVRTVQGARFGMEPPLIRRIYREPSRTRSDRMEYTHLGIDFEFESDRVAQIELYPRKR